MILRTSWRLLLWGVAMAGLSQEPAHPGAQIRKDFQKRIEDYMNLRKTARAGLDKLKPTRSPAKIEDHEETLAHRIRALRRAAGQGDIFMPDVSAEFRRLIGLTMQGAEAARMRTSLRRAAPVHLQELRVNGTYPKTVPLQSTPPTLLLNLPKLPPDLQYRVVGRALVILDVEANLVVDFIPEAIPPRSHAT